MQVTGAQLETIRDLLDDFFFVSADVEQWHGVSFVQSDETPRRYDGNHVRRIDLDPAISLDEFFAELDRRFSHLPFRSVRVTPWTRPLALEARLGLEGYDAETELVMAIDRPPGGRAADIDLRRIEHEAGWSQLEALVRLEESYEGEVEEVMHLNRRRAHAFSTFLAVADGKAVGHFSEFTRDRVGYLEDLYVDPAYRNRGIATALVQRCAAEVFAKGAALAFLPCAAGDTPKLMYAKMGFEPVFAFRNYLKLVST